MYIDEGRGEIWSIRPVLPGLAPSWLFVTGPYGPSRGINVFPGNLSVRFVPSLLRCSVYPRRNRRKGALARVLENCKVHFTRVSLEQVVTQIGKFLRF